MKVERVPRMITEHDILITLEPGEAHELLVQLNVLHGHYLHHEPYPHPKMLVCASLQDELYKTVILER